jgi:hypothetical protein
MQPENSINAVDQDSVSSSSGDKRKPAVVVSPKNVGVSIILTVLFGPLGMFYSTIIGGIVMTIVSAVVGIATFGIGLAVTWPVSVIWGLVSTMAYNRRIMS